MGFKAQGFRFRVGWAGLLARGLSQAVLPGVSRKQEDILVYRDCIPSFPTKP